MKNEKAMVALGPEADVKLIRSGDNELSVSADKTNFFGSVSVNGKPLEGKCIEGKLARVHVPLDLLHPNSKSPYRQRK